MRYTHHIPGGAAWSAPVPAGRLVRLTALDPDANASVLLYGPDRLDRLNVPDTMKAQMSACIRPPMVLMSDRGLALASVVSSTASWHDCLTGFGHDAHLARFGPSSYAEHRNDWRRSARSGLVSELTKHGLGEADLHAPVNFFTKVGIVEDVAASLAWVPGHTSAGDEVVLRTELDLLLVVSTAAHPMSTAAYGPAGVRVDVDRAPAPSDDDVSAHFRDESGRALAMAGRVLA